MYSIQFCKVQKIVSMLRHSVGRITFYIYTVLKVAGNFFPDTFTMGAGSVFPDIFTET